jgi:hypothetical protein
MLVLSSWLMITNTSRMGAMKTHRALLALAPTSAVVGRTASVELTADSNLLNHRIYGRVTGHPAMTSRPPNPRRSEVLEIMLKFTSPGARLSVVTEIYMKFGNET